MFAKTVFRSILPVLGLLLMLGGCRAIGGAEGETPDEQRATIRSEKAATLEELYTARPETREKVKKAVGVAFFSNVNVNVLLLSSENGYGIVHDNTTGKDTYMKMAGAGVGVGLGLKDYRAIFIFNDAAVMQRFIEKGWDFGGQGDAAAKTGDKGGAAGGSVTVEGMEIYQFTKHGLALQATVQGTKYWRDTKLNP
jgi:lipid-binding SYLF domain-containing protein